MNDTMKDLERRHRRKKIIIISIIIVVVLALIVGGYLLWRKKARKDRVYTEEELIQMLQNRTFGPATDEEVAAIETFNAKTATPATPAEIEMMQALRSANQPAN